MEVGVPAYSTFNATEIPQSYIALTMVTFLYDAFNFILFCNDTKRSENVVRNLWERLSFFMASREI